MGKLSLVVTHCELFLQVAPLCSWWPLLNLTAFNYGKVLALEPDLVILDAAVSCNFHSRFPLQHF